MAEEVHASLLQFIPDLSAEFSSPLHLRDWCDCIERSIYGGVRALCAVPIRHHKTETTIHGVAFLLKRDPTLRIIYMVADHEIASDRGKRIRMVCEAAEVGPERGQNVITSWRNARGGGVQTMSAKQSRLGQDCDILIFDDPISEFDAIDPKVRQAVDMAIAHYTARAGRTGGKRGSVLGVMSRWHPDDPIGRRLVRTAETWEYIHSPAIIDDGLPTEHAFAEDVMPLEELKRRRAELREVDPSERLWWAQFQNDPLPDSLGLFKSPKRYHEVPTLAGFRTVLGADLAYSASLDADWFALVALRIWRQYVELKQRDGSYLTTLADVGYVMNCWRSKWEPGIITDSMQMARAMYPGAPCFSYMSGPEIGIVHYLAEKGCPVQVMPARYSKRQRAQKTIDRSNAGLILLPESAPWVSGFIARMILFTGLENAGLDDETDALVSAADGGMMTGVTAPKTIGKRRI